MRYTLTALILFGCLVFGCAPMVTSYRVEPDGRVTKLPTVTADEHWKQLVSKRIAKELAGEKPEGGSPDWEHYWRTWYAGIRKYPKPAWRSSEFKSAEDMVAYMKQQRAAKGLPTYD